MPHAGDGLDAAFEPGSGRLTGLAIQAQDTAFDAVNAGFEDGADMPMDDFAQFRLAHLRRVEGNFHALSMLTRLNPEDALVIPECVMPLGKIRVHGNSPASTLGMWGVILLKRAAPAGSTAEAAAR